MGLGISSTDSEWEGKVIVSVGLDTAKSMFAVHGVD